MIDKLDEFEKQCKSNLVSFELDCKLEENIGKWANDLQKWFKQLNTFEKNIDRWETILSESNSNLKELQTELLNFNESLFLNRLNEIHDSDFNSIRLTFKAFLWLYSKFYFNKLINFKIRSVRIE